jgi:PQQ-dependent dehydrogenase (methanol/ethanol family)
MRNLGNLRLTGVPNLEKLGWQKADLGGSRMGNRSAAPLSRANRSAGALVGVVFALATAPSLTIPAQASDIANVDDARIIENAKTGKEWPSTGLDYGVNRFSPLDQITTANVGKLGLAWSYDLDSNRGVEATPIGVDGTMYVTAPWGVVHAINAKTGEKIWTFDPQSPRDQSYRLCCDVVNRGVAVYKGKVYVESPDARLIALDATTGKVLFSVDASPDRTCPYTLTGAPLVARGKVIVGGGGGEYGVRGVLSAFDAETGKLAWRWYTVRSFETLRERGDGQGRGDLGR